MTGTWPEIRAWYEAVDGGAGGSAAKVATPDVGPGGPRGTAVGLAVLERWIADAAIHLVPRAWHEVTDRVVAAEEGATLLRRPDAAPSAAAIRVATA